MTIIDSTKSSTSSTPLLQASFTGHLPPFMLQSSDDDPMTIHENGSTQSPQSCSEKVELKKSSDQVHEQTIIDFTVLATEQNDQVLEGLLEEQDIDGAYKHILTISKEMLDWKDFERSMCYAFTAIISQPIELQAYMIYASALSLSGECEEALKWLDETKTFFPEESSIFRECYYITKKVGKDKQTQEALLNWLKTDKNDADAWIEMIEKEKEESLDQALETTNKVLKNHSQDPKLLRLKEELEKALEQTPVDTFYDMNFEDSSSFPETTSTRKTRTPTPQQQKYPYLYNSLSKRGLSIDEINISTIKREVWRRKLQTLSELKNTRRVRNLQHENRKKKLRETRRRYLTEVHEPSRGFTLPIASSKGRHSLNPKVRSIALYSTEKNEELQDRKLSFVDTLESRRAVQLPQEFLDKTDFFISEFHRNGVEPIEVIDSMVRLSGIHNTNRRRYEWRCHIIPIQRRSRQDNLIGAIIAGTNLIKKPAEEVISFLKLLNRVNNITMPKICLLARINSDALNSNRAGNSTIHKFLWKELQQHGRVPTDKTSDILKNLEFQGFKIKVFSKSSDEEVLINGNNPHRTIRLLKTQIGEHPHYDLLYPQLSEEEWSDGILINDCLLKSGMSQDDVDNSKISITLKHGKSISTHQFDVIPLVCNPNHNFYQAVVSGVNTYQYQMELIEDVTKSLLTYLEKVINQSGELKVATIHQASKTLSAFVRSIHRELKGYQIEEYSQKFREMIPLLNAFDKYVQGIQNKPFFNLLLDTHTLLRKFHHTIGDLQNNINHMKMEHDRSFPPSSIIARKNPNSLLHTNLNSSNTHHWLWKEIQQNGELKVRGVDQKYTDLQHKQIPDAIRRDLENLGYKVVIWVKGSRSTNTISRNFEFENRYLLPTTSNLKTIHLLESTFSSRKHYDLLIPKEGVQTRPISPSHGSLSRKRNLVTSKETVRGATNKRHCRHTSPRQIGGLSLPSLQQGPRGIYSRGGRGGRTGRGGFSK